MSTIKVAQNDTLDHEIIDGLWTQNDESYAIYRSAR